jgi:magnesium transporter
VGDVPGTLVPDPFSSPTEVRVVRYGKQDFEETSPNPLDFQALKPKDGVLWLDVDGLADTDLVQKLGEHFQIHRLALEDVLYSHQPKSDDFGTHLQVCFTALGEEVDATEAISMFVGSNFVLTFQAGMPGDPFEPVRSRLRSGRGLIRERGADYLAYTLLDATIDAYFPLVDSWANQLSGFEELVMERPTTALWNRICAYRGNVLELRRSLRHFREAIATLLSYEGNLIHADTRPYYRDLHTHLLELVDALDGLRETTGELMSSFHARQSQKTNDIMQMLTIISTIFIPLTFIAGIYGMNFSTEKSPFNMPELGWRYGYPLCLTLMLGITTVQLWFFWKRGWILQRDHAGQLPQDTENRPG